MDLKIFGIFGLIFFGRQTCGTDLPSSASSTEITQQFSTIESSSSNWLPMTSPPTTITRLHPVNTTEIQESDVAPFFDIVCLSDVNKDNYKLEILQGDIIVSFILHQSSDAANIIKFISDRVNKIGLLAHNISLGVRIIHVVKSENLLEIVESEVDYMEHCVENPFGIFVSAQFWQHVSKSDKNYEFKMWPLHDIERIKMQKAAHLLNELPLPNENASVELKTDSINRTKEFQEIVEMEGICFKNFPSSDHIFVYVGNETFFESQSFATNQSLIIVPLTSQYLNENELPNGAFMMQENEIKNISMPSTFITIAATLLEVSNAINKAILKISKNSPTLTKLNLTKCEICSELEIFSGELTYQNPKEMLNTLQINEFESQLNYNLYQKFPSEMRKLATTNYVTNVTTIFSQDLKKGSPLGSLFKCTAEPKAFNSSHIDGFRPDKVIDDEVIDMDDLDSDFKDMYWELKTELWVAIGLTMSTLGILLSMAILTFIIIRICMDDVLEGNPIGSIVMLIALIAQFTSFFPFTIEYVSTDLVVNYDVKNSMCIIKLFLVSVTYCLTFSLLLSRAIMLASIGSEGGFLSHVNGYIQSIICFFSFVVQLGLSIQLLIVLHANSRNVTCVDIYNGNWFWAVISYDAFILLMLVLLAPFIFKSQRNYHEGVLIVITSILCVICWAFWIPLSMIDDNFREIMISLGVQTSAWIILATLMVPRCFLIVKSIARSDFTQALPSLTSLAFAQANQFISDPSIYECVNPTMRSRSIGGESDQTNLPNESYQSPSEVPTLPLRSGRRNLIEHYNLNFNEIVNPNLPSPNKMTRF